MLDHWNWCRTGATHSITGAGAVKMTAAADVTTSITGVGAARTTPRIRTQKQVLNRRQQVPRTQSLTLKQKSRRRSRQAEEEQEQSA